jgi:hypothetical protein
MNFDQIKKVVENDLTWFFCFSMADVGIKSNWEAMCSVALFGPTTTLNDHMSSSVMQAVDRRREIEKKFFKLSIEDQSILYAMYSDFRIHPYIQKIFQDLAPIVYLSRYEPEFIDKICGDIISSKATPKEQIIMTDLRINCRNKFIKAIKSYIRK